MRKGEATRREERPPVCVGCGGVANGYMYEAPSCFSCKSFFRRTVAEQRVYLQCLKRGMCEKDDRIRQCRACRFFRCIKGGMNPASVANHSNPDINAVVKRFCTTSESEESIHIIQNPLRIEMELEKVMENLLILEDAHHKLRISTYSPKIVPSLIMEDYVSGSTKLGEKFERMDSQPYEISSIRHYPTEIFIKRRMVANFSIFDYTNRKLWAYQDIIYAIEFMKALPVFSMLCNSSKKIWLASVIVCANFTAAFYSFMQKSDRTRYPDGITMSWSEEMSKESPDSNRFHTVLIAAMKELQLEEREYTLLKMIVVCNPMLSGLNPHDANLLQQEKEKYTKTLLSYALAKYGSEGPAIFAKLLLLVDLVNRLTSWQKNQYILMFAMSLFTNRIPFVETICFSQ